MDIFVRGVLFVLYLFSGRGSLVAAVTIAPSYARYYVLSGAQLQLNCSNSGQTGALKWYRDEIGLSSDDATRLTISSEMSGEMTHSTLTYTSADSTMSGEYKCKLEIGSPPTVEQESAITIHVISITTTDAEFITRMATTIAVLQCQTTDAVDFIRWMKDTTPVKDLKPKGRTRYTEFNGTLEIQYPTREDAGVYVCRYGDENKTEVEKTVTLYAGP